MASLLAHNLSGDLQEHLALFQHYTRQHHKKNNYFLGHMGKTDETAMYDIEMPTYRKCSKFVIIKSIGNEKSQLV